MQVEWSGEGLPPVGETCEFCEESDWVQVRILAHDNALAVFNYNGYYIGRSHNKFRPIRTAEQIAEEERQVAISKIVDDSMGRCDHVGAGYLYDAMYRKQVTP